MGKTERASIDEAYVDLTAAAKERMKAGPMQTHALPADTSASHILGLPSAVSLDKGHLDIGTHVWIQAHMGVCRHTCVDTGTHVCI